MNDLPLVVNDPARFDFRVRRSAMVDAAILEREMRAIFDRCWIYAGHESEVRSPGDFVTRTICGRPILMCRDSAGAVRVFLNVCRHRGAVVCRERSGNAKGYTCFYHGWSYDRDGRLNGVPGESHYPPGFDRGEFGLASPPRVDAYRGFVFVCFDANVAPLADWLAGAKEYIDLVVDQSPTGEMEIIRGTQEYSIRANWKLLVENSFDDYHLMSTHSTWLDYMKRSGVAIPKPPKGHVMPSHGIGKALGNGHAVIDNENFRGRPVAKWIPPYGEDAKPEIERLRAELVARLGEARARRIADTNRNLLIFPNLMLQDGSSVTVRAFHPTAANNMEVSAWALGPKGESAKARAIRLDSFLTFYGPGGLATPDDIEALESVQQGLATWREVPWSVMTRGMAKEGDQLNTDELHLREFWIWWDRYMRTWPRDEPEIR